MGCNMVLPVRPLKSNEPDSISSILRLASKVAFSFKYLPSFKSASASNNFHVRSESCLTSTSAFLAFGPLTNCLVASLLQSSKNRSRPFMISPVVLSLKISCPLHGFRPYQAEKSLEGQKTAVQDLSNDSLQHETV